MPVLVRCGDCGETLKEWSRFPNENWEPTQTWYYKLYRELDGKCPKCGHKLPYPSESKEKIEVEVKPNPGENGRASTADAQQKAGLPEKNGKSARHSTSARPYPPYRGDES